MSRLDGSGILHHVIIRGIGKSPIGVLMTGQIDKILWHGLWDKGNRFGLFPMSEG